MLNIGNMYQAQGEYDEAHVQHQKSPMLNIGNMYQAQGEYDEAHVQHQKSL